MFITHYSVGGVIFQLLDNIHLGDQWIMVPDNHNLLEIIQTNDAYILETFSEGIHYIGPQSVFIILPQAEVSLNADGYRVLILSPFAGNYITLSRETWDLNLPTMTI